MQATIAQFPGRWPPSGSRPPSTRSGQDGRTVHRHRHRTGHHGQRRRVPAVPVTAAGLRRGRRGRRGPRVAQPTTPAGGGAHAGGSAERPGRHRPRRPCPSRRSRARGGARRRAPGRDLRNRPPRVRGHARTSSPTRASSGTSSPSRCSRSVPEVTGVATPGDLCAVLPYVSCGTCYGCRRGRANCCDRIEVLGRHPGRRAAGAHGRSCRRTCSPIPTSRWTSSCWWRRSGSAGTRSPGLSRSPRTTCSSSARGRSVSPSPRPHARRWTLLVVADVSADRVAFADASGHDSPPVDDDFEDRRAGPQRRRAAVPRRSTRAGAARRWRARSRSRDRAARSSSWATRRVAQLREPRLPRPRARPARVPERDPRRLDAR